MHIKPKKETIIGDGWYPATIGELEERETSYGEKLLFPFEVDAAEEGIVAIDAWISPSDHPKSNLVKWGRQLFGEREFDTDEFINAEVEAFVEEGVDKEERPKNFIRKLRPAKGKKAKAPKSGKAEVEIDETDFEDIPF